MSTSVKLDNFDEEIINIMKADTIRAGLLPGSRKSIYSVDSAWTMKEEPWRIYWTDSLTDDKCLINPLSMPWVGKKYVMFQSYEEDNGRVVCYVFLNDQYHYLED